MWTASMASEVVSRPGEAVFEGMPFLTMFPAGGRREAAVMVILMYELLGRKKKAESLLSIARDIGNQSCC